MSQLAQKSFALDAYSTPPCCPICELCSSVSRTAAISPKGEVQYSSQFAWLVHFGITPSLLCSETAACKSWPILALAEYKIWYCITSWGSLSAEHILVPAAIGANCQPVDAYAKARPDVYSGIVGKVSNACSHACGTWEVTI